MTEYLFRGGPCNGERLDVPMRGHQLPEIVYVPNPDDLNAIRIGWTEPPGAIEPRMTQPIAYTRERLARGGIEYWSADYRATAMRAQMPILERLAILEREVAAAQSQIERLSRDDG